MSEVDFCDMIEKLNQEHDEALTENAKLRKENEEIKRLLINKSEEDNDFLNDLWCAVMDLQELHQEFFEPWIGRFKFNVCSSGRTKVELVNSLLNLKASTLGSIVSFHKSRMPVRNHKKLKPLEEEIGESLDCLKDFLYEDRKQLDTNDKRNEYYKKCFDTLTNLDYDFWKGPNILKNIPSKKSFKIFKR